MQTTALDRSSPVDHAPSGADVWNAIVQAAIRSYRTRAFHEVTLEVVAAASGLGIDAVLERFATQDDLVVAAVQVWNGDRTAVAVPVAERHGAVPFLRVLVQADVEDPSLIRLLTAVINIAATPGHPMAHVLQRQWCQFFVLVERSLARDMALGREPDSIEPSRAAEQLVAVYEGLQLQMLTRPRMDPLDAFDHAVARLRTGWSAEPAYPVWDL